MPDGGFCTGGLGVDGEGTEFAEYLEGVCAGVVVLVAKGRVGGLVWVGLGRGEGGEGLTSSTF